MAVLADVAGYGIAVIKVLILLHRLQVLDDVLPASQVKPLLLFVYKLQAPFVLYVVQSNLVQVVAVVTIGTLANQVDRFAGLVSSAQQYQCLGLVQ